MKNVTPELLAQAKAAKSAEQLFKIANENNVEITETEAKTYYEQLNANGAVDDDELDLAAGGCGGSGETVESYYIGETVRITDGGCPVCKCTLGVIEYVDPGNSITSVSGAPSERCVICASCAKVIFQGHDMHNKIAKI